MTTNKKPPKNEIPVISTSQNLRGKAEARVKKNSDSSTENSLKGDTNSQLLHELQVHQIELEMQNEELRESNNALDIVRTRYFDLYDLAPIGYLTLNEHGLIQQANLTVASLFGMVRSTLIKQPLSKLILKADQDVYYLSHKKLIESGEPQSFDLRIVKSINSHLWVNCVIMQAQDGESAPELRVVLTDISERKQTEQALAESEEHYHTLFNSIDEGFCIIEVIFDHAKKPIDYLFLELNPSFIKQSGLKNAQGKRMREFAPDFDPEWFEIYGNVVTTGRPIRFIKEAKELEERWFDVYAFRIGDQADNKVAVIFTDTSQRKHEEIKLKTARLVADKANLAKSEFLSSMSHELRTPLNAILGFAQLIESGVPPPTITQKRNVDQILKAGWYLLELINEILDLAVIDSGKVLLYIETLFLAEVLNDVEAMLEHQAQKRGINMIFPRSGIPYFVKADRIRVKQVFVNLLSNAIKYNKPSGSVTVSYTEKSNQRIRICVEDTGEGLTVENIAQLFQPFNRLGKESSEEEGTGIGLVVSKRIVELMGGEIGVESTVGKGSVFWVELNLTHAL
jgi:PAS domain S-box-containing protein